ncbi:hypothetical protein PX701_00195 [Agromyces sp. H3Y2-19a]|uniref:hypothetical protein n=1 Tax=Agromyces TaxID=33877 RepID=UPI001E29D46D|nr:MULTISPECIES: hypothetical protein [Agromyces]MCD5345658.1 hypothetical protein [Agromyces sp. S2-1-8]MDF0512025.1 hypothetical protein [Agromyces chromiiresistens]
MNLQRIAAVVAISGAVIGGASIVALGAAAYAANQPQPERVAEPGAGPVAVGDDGEPLDATESYLASLPKVEPGVPTPPPQEPKAPPKPGTGTMAASYNPYLEPSDPDYVTMEERSEYLGVQELIRQCMAERGYEYRIARWWLEEDSQPVGLDFETSVLWGQALLGPDHPYSLEGGCGTEAEAAAEAARAAGTPLSAPVPPDDPDLPTPREKWLGFQDDVRRCMADKGFEYLYFEWWNPAYLTPDPMDVDPQDAMPDDLTPEQEAEWALAEGGDAGTGSAYRWEDAGCYGYAVHVNGRDAMH